MSGSFRLLLPAGDQQKNGDAPICTVALTPAIKFGKRRRQHICILLGGHDFLQTAIKYRTSTGIAALTLPAAAF